MSPEPNVYEGAFDKGAGLLAQNVYAYSVNNPISYFDYSGEFVVSTTLICVVAGVIIGGTVGGLVGNAIADSNGCSGWEKTRTIIYGVIIGGVIGGVAGYFAAPTVVSATGVGSVSITISGGITTIPATLLGQNHHVLSNPLMKALNEHSLKGLFQRAGSLVQALYEYSHKGYQSWHRAIDTHMVGWLNDNPNATANQFWQELYNQYNTKDMIKRFGEGVLNYIKSQMK